MCNIVTSDRQKKLACRQGLINTKEPAWWIFGRPQRQIIYYLTDLGSLNGTYLNR